MKFLIPEDEFGVFANQGGVAMVDSLFVAAAFEKEHRHVLCGISPESLSPNLDSVKVSSVIILYPARTRMPEEENCRVTC